MNRQIEQNQNESAAPAKSLSVKGRIVFLLVFGLFWLAMGFVSLQKVSTNPTLQFVVGGFCIGGALFLALRGRSRKN